MSRKSKRTIPSSEIDIISTSGAIFTNKTILRQIMRNAEESDDNVFDALEDKAGYTKDFIEAACGMSDEDVRELPYGQQVHVETIRELFNDEQPLFTRDDLGDPQLSPAYLGFMSAVETSHTRESLYPERDTDKGYDKDKHAYDGKDDPNEPEFLRNCWVVPSAIVRWPIKGFSRDLFRINDLWRMHRDEDMPSPRGLVASVKDAVRRQKGWLDQKIIYRTKPEWGREQVLKAREQCAKGEWARQQIRGRTSTCKACTFDKFCKMHANNLNRLKVGWDIWLRLAAKYIGKESVLFEELEGKTRLHRVEHHIRRKAKNRLLMPIGLVYLEDWTAGDLLKDLKRKVEGEWVISAFFDAEAAGLIELGDDGTYHEVD